LAAESIDKMLARGARGGRGDLGENITTPGIDLVGLDIRSRLRLGDAAELEITQFGKKCQERCVIFHQIGDCVMPRDGVFAKVVCPGRVVPGDRMEMLGPRGDIPR